MIASFTSFHQAQLSAPYATAQQGMRALRQIDGTPGDQNGHPNAISMSTSQGQLDAVILSHPDDSATVVQRLSKKSGEIVTSWLEIPQNAQEMTGFEISQSLIGLHGLALGIKETWTAATPVRSYENQFLASHESQNALMRAEAVLASYAP